jgi:hypothetical protein
VYTASYQRAHGRRPTPLVHSPGDHSPGDGTRGSRRPVHRRQGSASKQSGGCSPGVHTGSSSRPSTPPLHPTGSTSTSFTHKSLRRRWAIPVVMPFLRLLMLSAVSCCFVASAGCGRSGSPAETKSTVMNSKTGLLGPWGWRRRPSRSAQIRRSERKGKPHQKSEDRQNWNDDRAAATSLTLTERLPKTTLRPPQPAAQQR